MAGNSGTSTFSPGHTRINENPYAGNDGGNEYGKYFRGYPAGGPFDSLFQGMWNLGADTLSEFEPYITGYGYLIWTVVPNFFEPSMKTSFRALTERDLKAFSGHSDMTLDMEDMTHGFGGNTIAYATNIKKDNTTFSMKFYEKMGSPIRKMFEYWVTGIRDPETGLATYHGKIANGTYQYSAENHVGELLYIVTDPSGGSAAATNSNQAYGAIEYAEYWTNVIPTKIPMAHLDMEKGSHALQEIDIEFRGNWHVGHKVNELASNALKNYAIQRMYYDYDSFGGIVDNGSKAPGFGKGYDEFGTGEGLGVG